MQQDQQEVSNISDNIIFASYESTNSRGSGQRVSRKERSRESRERLARLQRESSKSPNEGDFSENLNNERQRNKSEKLTRKNNFKSTSMHLKETVTSQNRQTKSTASLGSNKEGGKSKSKSSKLGSSHRLSMGSSQKNLKKSKDAVSVQSQASLSYLNSKEKSKPAQISKQAQVPDTSPLTPLLQNMLFITSKQCSQDGKPFVSSFLGAEKSKPIECK